MSENMNDRDSGNKNTDLESRDEPRPRRKNFNDWWRERTLGEKILTGMGFAALGIGLLALLGLLVMLLWNWLMPDIFGLKQISYWQAWGLLILSTILFQGFGSGSSGSRSSSRNERKRKEQLRRYMQEDADTTTGD